MIIAVVGSGDRCGKSTAAGLIAKHLVDCVVVETGDVLRKIARIMHTLPDWMPDEVVTTRYRVELRTLGVYLADLDPCSLVNIALADYESDNVVVVGIRRQIELLALQGRFDGVVYVERDGADRGNCDIVSKDCCVVISNNGSLDELDALCAEVCRLLVPAGDKKQQIGSYKGQPIYGQENTNEPPST